MGLTWNQVDSITEKYFVKQLADNIFDSNPLLQRAKQKFYEKVDGGSKMIVPLNYATTSASGWFNGLDTLDTSDNSNITAAEYAWKQAYAGITISRKDELMNSGDAAKVNLVKSKTQIAEKTLADNLGTGLWSSGTDPQSISGLGLWMSTSNTVGGISQSSYSWWNPKLDTSTTTLTIGAMQSRFTAATVNNDSPSVIMTTRTLYNSYYGLLQPQQRFQDSETAKGGFSSLMFNSAPVIPDSHGTASMMAFLNEKYLMLAVFKDEDFRYSPFVKPPSQNGRVAQIFWMGAFGTSNLRLQAALTATTA